MFFLQIGASFNQTNVSVWVVDLGVCIFIIELFCHVLASVLSIMDVCLLTESTYG